MVQQGRRQQDFGMKTSHLCKKVAVAALLSVPGAELAFSEDQTPPVTIEYSVLTPALQGQYFVATTFDLSIVLSSYTNAARSKTLRELVTNEHYRATDNLALQLKDALTAAGFPADVEEVPRGPDGKAHGLSRGDLPPHPKGRYLIDVTIKSLGLVAKNNFSRWEPFFDLNWRILSPDGQILGFPHRYVHGPVYGVKSDDIHRTQDCDLPYFSTGTQDPAEVWACFDRAFRDASAILTVAIRDAQGRS
jgi:hypothetical protein